MTTDTTDYEPSEIDTHRVVVGFLFACYALPLLAAVGFFIHFAVTGYGWSLYYALVGCAMAWMVTDHLDEARAHLRALNATASSEVAS